jgi:hypothetical protein
LCIEGPTSFARKIFNLRAAVALTPERQRTGLIAKTSRSVGFGNLSETASDTVCHRVDHVLVDLVSDFIGEMRCPVGHALTWKRSNVLGADKRRQRSRGENDNDSFHVLSVLFTN